MSEDDDNFNVIESSDPQKTKNLLNSPPSTYPFVPLTQSYNTSLNLKIELRGSDRSGNIYCGDEN